MTSTEQTKEILVKEASPDKRDSKLEVKKNGSHLGNLVLMGEKNKSAFYVRMVKYLFAQGKYEDIDIQGRGEFGILRVSQVATTLTRWGYCSITKMTSKAYPSLRVSLKKSDQFDSIHEAFQIEVQKRIAAQKVKSDEEQALKKVASD